MKANRNRKQTKSHLDSTEMKGTLYSYNSSDDLINLNENNIRFHLPNGLVLREKKKNLNYLISPPKQYRAKPKNPSTIALLPSMKLVNDNKPRDKIDSRKKDRELTKCTNTHPYTKQSTVTSTNQLSKSTSRKNTKQSTAISSYQLSRKDSMNYIVSNYFNEVKAIQKGKSCLDVMNKDKAEIVSHIYSLSLLKRMNSLIANNK